MEGEKGWVLPSYGGGRIQLDALETATRLRTRTAKWIDWEKLAARAGFKDGTTAQAHYQPLLKPTEKNHAAPTSPSKKREAPDDDDIPHKRANLSVPVAKGPRIKVENSTHTGAEGQDNYINKRFCPTWNSNLRLDAEDLENGEA
ncbi:hypothetical protein DL766_010254 [Monosporascus sp. MC13-8B]|nr:hypothetical protein DL766_010254 [Monosporascus sp. MC13-8B]